MLAPLLRSNLQGELLALLYLHPSNEYSLVDLARDLGAKASTVHAEVNRLATAGWITQRRVGRSRLVRADTDHVLARPLTEILELTYGATALLPDVLAALPDVREAHIYGSWAARRQGEPGNHPRDVDVVVVGTTPRDLLLDAGERASRLLHRDVNITRVHPDVWDVSADPFVETLRSRPLVQVHPRPADEAAPSPRSSGMDTP
jgi:DNA-binding transcriptional ArsR family regulator